MAEKSATETDSVAVTEPPPTQQGSRSDDIERLHDRIDSLLSFFFVTITALFIVIIILLLVVLKLMISTG